MTNEVPMRTSEGPTRCEAGQCQESEKLGRPVWDG